MIDSYYNYIYSGMSETQAFTQMLKEQTAGMLESEII